MRKKISTEEKRPQERALRNTKGHGGVSAAWKKGDRREMPKEDSLLRRLVREMDK